MHFSHSAAHRLVIRIVFSVLFTGAMLLFTGCRSRIFPSEPSADNTGAPVEKTDQATQKHLPTDWPLTLVNETHPLSASYIPALGQVNGSEKQLEIHAAEALNQLLADAEKAQVPCFLVSGYRSVSYQQGLFDRKVRFYLDAGLPQTEAEQQAAAWVARPGTSEHALGLAADLVSGDWYLNHSDLTEEFETTKQFAWLTAHAAEYGFILRYPKEKEPITAVHYEPWHWRWVGEAAVPISQSGLCLEEWLSADTHSSKPYGAHYDKETQIS